ncbi:MAG: DUF2339 domain-containing protein [Clostridiales bacterium]
MDYKRSFEDILKEQKKLVQKEELLLNEIAKDNLLEENLKLKDELKKLINDNKVLKSELKDIKNSNSQLKTALFERLIDEKTLLLGKYKEKLDIYIQKSKESNISRLEEFENALKSNLIQLKRTNQELSNEIYNKFNEKIKTLESYIDAEFAAKRKDMLNSHKSVERGLTHKIDDLKNQELENDSVNKIVKESNYEIKFGLNWINKIGMIIILIAFSTMLRYAYLGWFSKEFKGIFAFSVGIIFIIISEIMIRKNKNFFALGLCGGGIGILYVALFHSYFNLQIINMEIALLLSIIVTTVAILFSLRFNSISISVLSLVGGFIPFLSYLFAYGFTKEFEFHSAFGYLLLLNSVTLAISVKKRWQSIKYVSYILNIPSILYLVFLYIDKDFGNEYIASIYVMLTFAIYLTVVLLYPIIQKLKLLVEDYILIIINTVISCSSIYLIFNITGHDFNGILSFLFSVIYLLLAFIVSKFIKSEKLAKTLLYLTSYMFAIIAIPQQFGIKWFAIGWLVEGLLVFVYGYKKKYKYVEISGLVVAGLCYFGVVVIDFFRYEIISVDVPFFQFRYICITIVLIAITYVYLKDYINNMIRKYSIRGAVTIFLKYFMILNSYFYLVYSSQKLFNYLLADNLGSYNQNDFFKTLIFITITIITAYAIDNIIILISKVTKVLSIILYIFSNLLIFISTLAFNPFKPEKYLILSIIAVLLVILFNIFTLLNIRKIVLYFSKEFNFNIEFYPIIITIILLLNTSIILSRQFDLGGIKMIFSIFYIIVALLAIVYGFKYKYVYQRRFGLVLSIFSTGKLFIYDLVLLEVWMRIISYFVFGIVLIGISYIYQHYSRQIQSDVIKK